MRRGDGRLLVERGDELDVVLAVVDDRFLQPFEARAGIRHHELDADRLQRVDHQIGSGADDGARRNRRRRGDAGFARELLRRRFGDRARARRGYSVRAARRCDLRVSGWNAADQRRCARRAHRGARQKSPAIE